MSVKAKRCKACGLTKVADCFHRTSCGTLQPRCKACHREVARDSRRRRAPFIAARDAARHRWRYRLDPKHRAERLAYMARHWRRTRGIDSRRVA